jgi:hypothetical protein
MGSNLSNKNPKKEIKTRNPIDHNPLLCSQCGGGEASLSSRRTAPSTLIKNSIPLLKNLDLITTVEK